MREEIPQANDLPPRTHPVDIERAMQNDYSADPEQRNLQLEAKAHVAVQRWVDEGAIRGRTVAVETICEVHRRFSALLPDELLIGCRDCSRNNRLRIDRQSSRQMESLKFAFGFAMFDSKRGSRPQPSDGAGVWPAMTWRSDS